jgi:hypothetical protein
MGRHKTLDRAGNAAPHRNVCTDRYLGLFRCRTAADPESRNRAISIHIRLNEHAARFGLCDRSAQELRSSRHAHQPGFGLVVAWGQSYTTANDGF